MNTFKKIVVAVLFTAFAAQAAGFGDRKLLSVRAELLLGLEASAVGGVAEGAIFMDNGLYLSVEGGGGIYTYGGLANLGWHIDNSPLLGQVLGLSSGYKNIIIKTDLLNKADGKPIEKTVNENHLSFGGVFHKLLIGKNGMFDITNRVMFGTSNMYDYDKSESQNNLAKDNRFNVTYSLSLGYAFGRRKSSAIPAAEESPKSTVDTAIAIPAAEEISKFTVNTAILPSEGASAEPAGSVSVEKGSDLELVFTVKDGFVLEKILVNSEPVGAVWENNKYKYTLRSISQNMSVEGHFGKVMKIKISKVATIQDGITFKTGMAELTPQSHGALEGLYMTLVEYPDTKIEVAGHTDMVGTREYNLDLSKRRAQTVVNYFIARGIPPNRLISVGYGAEKPIAGNATEEGRAKNRRVEIRTVE